MMCNTSLGLLISPGEGGFQILQVRVSKYDRKLSVACDSPSNGFETRLKHRHVGPYIHTHTYTYTYTRIYTHTHIHIHMHTHTHTHVHTRAHTYTRASPLGTQGWLINLLLSQ